MHFIILGGSGRTGKAVISYALAHNHQVTALLRTPTSLPPTTNLTIIQGSPTNVEDITLALTSTPANPPTAIIVTLASLRKSDSPFAPSISPPSLMTDANTAAIKAMKLAGVKRIITLSAFGVGDSKPNVFFPLRYVLYHFGMLASMQDHAGVEEVVRSSGLEWTLVRPVMLWEGEGSDIKVFGDNGEGVGLVAKVARESVAAFLVGRCLEKGEWVGGTPVIADS